MENILGITGAICGVLGLPVSVLAVRRQTKVQAEEMAIERACNDRSEGKRNRHRFISEP
ncbi:MAG: hypothetical protein LBH43_12740 [Treponema sp.]|nr:hypothetical protein [Treponema sp.]